MSFTNTTPNYGLPQYVADDKPTYLGDFNKAMLDIDTAIKTNDTKASSAESTANTANANATQALETATNADTTAQNADTNATQAKTLVDNLTTRVSNAETDASSAKTIANTANTNAQSAVQTANLAQSTAQTANTTAEVAKTTAELTTEWQAFNILNTNNPNINTSTSSLTLIYNSALKLFNIYGEIHFTSSPTPAVDVIGNVPSEIEYTQQYNIFNGFNTTTADSQGRNSGTLIFLPNNTITFRNIFVDASTVLQVQACINISQWS